MNQTIYTCTLCLPQPLCQKFKQSARNSRHAVKQSKRIVTRLDLFIFIFLSMLPQLAQNSRHAVKQSGHIVTRSDLFILIFLSMLPFSCYVYPRFDLYNCDILHIPHHIQVKKHLIGRIRLRGSRRRGEDILPSKIQDGVHSTAEWRKSRKRRENLRSTEEEEARARAGSADFRLRIDGLISSTA